MEIEKKFLVNKLPENLNDYKCLQIEQGYVLTRPTLRIRRMNDEFILTYKSPVAHKSNARVNTEIEAPLDEGAFNRLKEKCDGYFIEKERFIIPLSDGHKAELDVFKGRYEGLLVVEVEFGSEEEIDDFIKPDWFGEDVSEDYRYTNSYMAETGDVSFF